jgi:hypothetical protein
MPLDSPIQRDGDRGFLGFASRLNPLTLPAGMLQLAENVRLDRGVAQVRKGALRLATGISTEGSALVLDFTLAADVDVTSITRVGTAATVTTTAAHGYTGTPVVNISGATDPLYNGDFTIAVTSTTQFTYTMTGTPAANATGTILANKGPIVRNVYTGGIFGAGVYASKNYDSADEYIVLCGPDRAFLWREDATAATPSTLPEISYPTSGSAETIEPTDTVSVVQAFDRLYVLREADQTVAGWGAVYRGTGVTAGTCTMTIASPAVVTKTAHGLLAGMPVVFSTTGALPTGLTAGAIYYVISTGLGANDFRVSTSAGGAAVNTSGTQSGTHTVTPVSAIVSTTTATIYSKAHGYSAGQRVRLEGSAVSAFAGHEYDILASPAPTADSFAVTVPNPTSNDITADLSIRKVKPPIYWTGSGDFVRSPAGVPTGLGPTYKSMRSVGWAAFISNRLVIPDGRTQIMISDWLDGDTYDPVWSSFRAGSGGNDFIVGVHPWVDNTALVFCRKSVWLAVLAQFPSTDGGAMDVDTAVVRMELVTDEIGCSARDTIVTAGNYVFFLSDAGVYRLDTKLDLKLRGDTKPLSDPIADLFAGVNASRVNKAFAIWHDNRYLLALPTTADAADGNDLVVCYNALNDQWEFRDSYTIGVDQIVVSTYANRRRVFNVRNSGSLYLLDEKDSGKDDTASTGTEFTVTGRIKTRRYDFGDMHSKRFLRVIADTVLPSGSSVTSKIVTINPDTETTIGALTNSTGGSEDYNMKTPVRYKAHAAEVIFEMTNGRPELRSASIEASPKSLPPTETRNAA